MFNVLSIGRSGLNANQFKMDAIADELANVNTDGYKKRSISFQELLVNQDINMGSKSVSSKIEYAQGILTQTGGKFHMAIAGEGFFGLEDESGNSMYTRNGNFSADQDNILRNSSGDRLQIEYFIPSNQWESTDLTILEDGSIQEEQSGEILGRVMLYRPENKANLLAAGENKFIASPGENMIEYGQDANGFGKIRQGFIEGSNADITRAMTEMIVTQRTYSLNSSTVQSTDELMRLINEIKR